MMSGCYFVNDKRKNPPTYATTFACLSLLQNEVRLEVKYLAGYYGEVFEVPYEDPDFVDDGDAGIIKLPTPFGIMEFTFATAAEAQSRNLEAEFQFKWDDPFYSMATTESVQRWMSMVCGDME